MLTARGLPAELVVAVMLFLASPGAKRLMNEHLHRVHDAVRGGVVLPDGEGHMEECYRRGGAFSTAMVVNAKSGLSWCAQRWR